jgi:hypothetical protein
MNINITIQHYQFEAVNDENDEDWNNDDDANVDNLELRGDLEIVYGVNAENVVKWIVMTDEQSVCCAEFENIKICIQHW